ncbi:hypothetical protein A6R68_11727, partial [Neotoma lepida]
GSQVSFVVERLPQNSAVVPQKANELLSLLAEQESRIVIVNLIHQREDARAKKSSRHKRLQLRRIAETSE